MEGIFGVSKDCGVVGKGFGWLGLVFNGYDYEGCDMYYYVNYIYGEKVVDWKWEMIRWVDVKVKGFLNMEFLFGWREIIVCSMMGDFGGNVGLLSMWFD